MDSRLRFLCGIVKHKKEMKNLVWKWDDGLIISDFLSSLV